MSSKIVQWSMTVLCWLSFRSNVFAQQVSPDIRSNQVGFYTKGHKLAVVIGENRRRFSVKTESGQKVFTGNLKGAIQSQYSGKVSRIADFSGLDTPGRYYIEVAGLGRSAVFTIGTNVHRDVVTASLRGFYYQRASIDLLPEFAGKWARSAGHPDLEILIHPSVSSKQSTDRVVIKSPGGWYDAGDYNKYVVNSGITMSTLMSLYEDYPAFFEDLKTNIPESKNGVPDLLDEIVWNLRWMLTMQDPVDGGVYHKLTNARFDAMVMPEACKKPRYVVKKSTTASLDFTAVMAQASRIFKNFNKQLPGLADSCSIAAAHAWQWAEKNPDVVYDQNEMNKHFEPVVVTGAYGDKSSRDEWQWAAVEMYALTSNEEYLTRFDGTAPFKLPTWNQVAALGCYTILRSAEQLKTPSTLVASVKQSLLTFADSLVKDRYKQPYRTVMGKSSKDYVWGSNAVAANQGVALLTAYRIKRNKSYLDAALANLDYLLGRNATGYCFLTGFGSKTVKHPHHRVSIADGIEEPVPGLLSGGPNPGQQDHCKTYPNSSPDGSFTDQDCSYASNEIAINWNAPMVYLSAAVEAIMEKAGKK
jgi:endoglucanase